MRGTISGRCIDEEWSVREILSYNEPKSFGNCPAIPLEPPVMKDETVLLYRSYPIWKGEPP